MDARDAIHDIHIFSGAQNYPAFRLWRLFCHVIHQHTDTLESFVSWAEARPERGGRDKDSKIKDIRTVFSQIQEAQDKLQFDDNLELEGKCVPIQNH